MKKRLAIVGGGSSGLITLKVARERLPEWDVVCFESTDTITGCWGNPYPGFASTSTKYTTQFACFSQYSAVTQTDGAAEKADFFRNGEYGDYLEAFATQFGLKDHIRLQTRVLRASRGNTGDWRLSIRNPDGTQLDETFDCLVVCTGLAAAPKALNYAVDIIPEAELRNASGITVSNKKIVVFGGGESAVDYADRLANPELNNEVFLSLRSGIRVSPRYHPIRGVPSDFLRNRLLLSIHPAMRNAIGERFVRWRIAYQKQFEIIFPNRTASSPATENEAIVAERKKWAQLLTERAKDDLFNMFHNKSDDFLDAVANGRITIVGPPKDEHCRIFEDFSGGADVPVEPDAVVPAIGYRSQLSDLTDGQLTLSDFHLGCVHVQHPDAFAVGYARPVIGNIPTISEVQAEYVCGLIAGDYQRPTNLEQQHRADASRLASRFPKISLDHVHPVEMFPYCDRLAVLMGNWPQRDKGVWTRLRSYLAPATTLHYRSDYDCSRDRIYMPWLLVTILLALLPISAVYGFMEREP